jgi:hypothetical protein
MLIQEAIAAASTEHVVTFLLTAYVETLQRYEQTRNLFGGHVARVPIAGEADVIARLTVLHEMLAVDRYARSPLGPVLEEARGVLSMALERLHTFAPAKPEFRVTSMVSSI